VRKTCGEDRNGAPAFRARPCVGRLSAEPRHAVPGISGMLGPSAQGVKRRATPTQPPRKSGWYLDRTEGSVDDVPASRAAAMQRYREARRAMLWVALVAGASCDKPAIDKLPLPEPSAAPAKQPPPPPPSVHDNVGPPRQMIAFLAAHAHRELPWRVTVVERGPRGRVVHLPSDRALALVERLARRSSWMGGINGCQGPPFRAADRWWTGTAGPVDDLRQRRLWRASPRSDGRSFLGPDECLACGSVRRSESRRAVNPATA